MQQRVALKVQGNGPLGKLVTESDAYGGFRGGCGHAGGGVAIRLSTGAAVGEALGRQGLLSVVKDVRLQELAEGTVSLGAGTLDQALMVYLGRVEQVPSYVDIDVKLDAQGRLLAAGGLLLQAMPDYDPDVLRGWCRRPTICRRWPICWLPGRNRRRCWPISVCGPTVCWT